MQTMTNSVQTPIISAIFALIKKTATGEYSTSRSARGLRDVIGLQNKV